jgi:hypothetical protein
MYIFHYPYAARMKTALLLLVLLSAVEFTELAAAGNSTAKDLMIEIMLPGNITLGGTPPYKYYDRLFRITNLGHEPGTTDSIDAYGVYNLSALGVFFSSDFIVDDINSYKTAGTGSYNFTIPGEYTICGRIANSSVQDNNSLNDAACAVVTVVPNASSRANQTSVNETSYEGNYTANQTSNASGTLPDSSSQADNQTENQAGNQLGNKTSNETSNEAPSGQNASVSQNASFCNLSLSIRTEKDIFDDEAIVFFNELSPKPSNFSIEYWAEDLFGNVVKNRISTSNLNSKQFTPKTDETDRVFIIRSSLSLPCLEHELHAEKMVVYRTGNPLATKCNCEQTCKDSTEIIYIQNKTACAGTGTDSGSKSLLYLLSFYTRARNAAKSIRLYANIKGPENVSLPEAGLAVYRLIPVFNATLSEPQLLDFNASLGPGNNTFLALLYSGGRIVDYMQMDFYNNISQDDWTDQCAAEKEQTEPLNGGKGSLSGTGSSDAEPLMSYAEGAEDLSAGNAQGQGVQGIEESEDSSSMAAATGSTVYESSTARSFGFLPYLFIGLVVALAGFLIFRKL